MEPDQMEPETRQAVAGAGCQTPAEQLAAFAADWCRAHAGAVRTAATTAEAAQRARARAASGPASGTASGTATGSAGNGAGGESGGTLWERQTPKGVAVLPPVYSFYLAVTAGQVFELFDLMASGGEGGKAGIEPLGEDGIMVFAADVVAGALDLAEADAWEIINAAMEDVPAFNQTAEQARGLSDSEFQEVINDLKPAFARQFLLFCAAEKAAEMLFDAWRRDPAKVPGQDTGAADGFAKLIGVHVEVPQMRGFGRRAAVESSPALANGEDRPPLRPEEPLRPQAEEEEEEPLKLEEAAQEEPEPEAPEVDAPAPDAPDFEDADMEEPLLLTEEAPALEDELEDDLEDEPESEDAAGEAGPSESGSPEPVSAEPETPEQPEPREPEAPKEAADAAADDAGPGTAEPEDQGDADDSVPAGHELPAGDGAAAGARQVWTANSGGKGRGKAPNGGWPGWSPSGSAWSAGNGRGQEGNFGGGQGRAPTIGHAIRDLVQFNAGDAADAPAPEDAEAAGT